MASSNATLRAVIKATVDDFLQSYEDARATGDTKQISRTLTPDCMRHLVPDSLERVIGLPAQILRGQNVEDYEKRIGPELEVQDQPARVETSNLCIDVDLKGVAFRAVHHMSLRGNGPFSIEICWFLDFNDDGSKVTGITQFVDSAESARCLELMKGIIEEEN